jgi:hypothetical protein
MDGQFYGRIAAPDAGIWRLASGGGKVAASRLDELVRRGGMSFKSHY